MRRATCICDITTLYASSAKVQNAGRCHCGPQLGRWHGTWSLQGHLHYSRSTVSTLAVQQTQTAIYYVRGASHPMVKRPEHKTGHSLSLFRAPIKQSFLSSASEHIFKMCCSEHGEMYRNKSSSACEPLLLIVVFVLETLGYGQLQQAVNCIKGRGETKTRSRVWIWPVA
jgi:hypothetical protein